VLEHKQKVGCSREKLSSNLECFLQVPDFSSIAPFINLHNGANGMSQGTYIDGVKCFKSTNKEKLHEPPSTQTKPSQANKTTTTTSPSFKSNCIEQIPNKRPSVLLKHQQIMNMFPQFRFPDFRKS